MQHTCPNCGKTHEAVTFCPYCLTKVPAEEPPANDKPNRWTWKTFVFVAFIILAFFLVARWWVWWLNAPVTAYPFSLDFLI